MKALIDRKVSNDVAKARNERKQLEQTFRDCKNQCMALQDRARDMCDTYLYLLKGGVHIIMDKHVLNSTHMHLENNQTLSCNIFGNGSLYYYLPCHAFYVVCKEGKVSLSEQLGTINVDTRSSQYLTNAIKIMQTFIGKFDTFEDSFLTSVRQYCN